MEFRVGPVISPAYGTAAELLEASFARNPDSVALSADGRDYTYRELDEASAPVAAALRARGVGPGDRVGLCLPRDATLLTAMLGIIRSGAAYVPLDPSFPCDRLTFMMADAHLALLISTRALATAAGWNEATCGLLEYAILPSAPDPSERASSPSGQTATGGDAVYLLYTSGSTGRPKGVLVTHGSVVNFIASMERLPGMTAADRVLAITTLNFDIAVLEILVPWACGARVILANAEQAIDGDWLRETVEKGRVTIMQATPGTWRLLLDSGWRSTPQLKALVGGEALAADLAAEIMERCGELWNMYGPTETTVWSTCWKVVSPLAQGVSLGNPIANTSVCLLPLAEGVQGSPGAGEICIGGAGVAQGYFRQPELTAEKFIHVQMESGESIRVYRTGDLGRWRDDGTLEHLGRIDDQIKIRGYRIEPGEIEARLRTHPAVTQALVTKRDSEAGTSLLVAYFVPRSEPPSPHELRAYLKGWLPDYMIPQAFVALQKIPLLPNGKTDRRSLPPPQFEAEDDSATAPRTPVETALHSIWTSLLKIEKVGIHDNFFELGGDSLLAVRVARRVRTELQRECPLPEFFRNPTIAQLAIVLEQKVSAPERQVLALQAGGSPPALFCLCGIHLYQHLADHLQPQIPAYGVFVPSELHYVVPEGFDRHSSVPRLASDYVAIIRETQPHGPYRLAGFSFGGVVAFEIAQQLRKLGEPVELLALLDSDVPNLRRHTASTWVGRHLLRLRQLFTRTLRRFRSRSGPGGVLERREKVIQRVMHRYRAESYPGSAVYIEATQAQHDRPGYGWDHLIHNLAVHRLPGDHTDLLAPHGAGRVARIILASLGRS